MTIRRLFEWPLGLLLAAFACSALIGTSAAASLNTVQGVLIDKECSPRAETRIVSDPTPHIEGGMLWAYTHAPVLADAVLPTERLWRIHLRHVKISQL